jgi:hypothetical protein
MAHSDRFQILYNAAPYSLVYLKEIYMYASQYEQCIWHISLFYHIIIWLDNIQLRIFKKTDAHIIIWLNLYENCKRSLTWPTEAWTVCDEFL